MNGTNGVLTRPAAPDGLTTILRPTVASETVASPTSSAALRAVAARLRAEVGGPDRPTRTRFLAARPPSEATETDPSLIVVRVFLR